MPCHACNVIYRFASIRTQHIRMRHKRPQTATKAIALRVKYISKINRHCGESEIIYRDQHQCQADRHINLLLFAIFYRHSVGLILNGGGREGEANNKKINIAPDQCKQIFNWSERCHFWQLGASTITSPAWLIVFSRHFFLSFIYSVLIEYFCKRQNKRQKQKKNYCWLKWRKNNRHINSHVFVLFCYYFRTNSNKNKHSKSKWKTRDKPHHTRMCATAATINNHRKYFGKTRYLFLLFNLFATHYKSIWKIYRPGYGNASNTNNTSILFRIRKQQIK